MEKKEIIISDPVTVVGLTLIPVVQVSLNYWYDKGYISFSGSKQPVAVVVVSQSTKRVIKISGEDIPLDDFIEEVPDIKEALDRV